MDSSFTAAPQALGYLYQARYALYLILTKAPEFKISIEGLDDIAFERNGTPVELLQLKHHTMPTSLTSGGVDLWKTLRVWSTAYKNREIDVDDTVLSIITTAIAPDDSAAALLRTSNKRDPVKALIILEQAAANSRSKTIESAIQAFQLLTKSEQSRLINAIHIIDGSPNIINVVDNIKQLLCIAVRPQFIQSLYERLEGWWFGKVVEHLSGGSSQLISCKQVHNKIHELAEQFRPDALPVDNIEINTENSTNDRRLFILQLAEISIDKRRIEKAIIDHDKTYAQRSKWLREQLLLDGECEKYESILIDEWERQTLALKDENTKWFSPDESDLKDFGRLIYRWIDREADIRIRPGVTEMHIMRGSYHMLADRVPPQVWWHPNFPDIFEHEHCRK
jgi:hypothetical protein